MIATNGQPIFAPLVGNELMYVTNTQSDVFQEATTGQIYVLLSGRWFRSPSFQGPWEFVPSDHLPPAFAQIPANSPKANVLSSVAGTPEAKDARLDAQVPQTAAVARNAGQSLVVAYDGQPQFQPVAAASPVSYAINTPEAVLFVNGQYYCCHQAVWYTSPSPAGPWMVATSVPDAVYTLPPSCPDYYVRYCYVYDVTPDVVYCGYLPGYTGCYVYGPTVVYGTGYVYHGWYGHEYYARPYTWGFGVRYDVAIGAWGFGASYNYDRRWFIGAGDHHGWWGPRGFIDYHTISHTYGGRVDVHNTVVHNTVINRLNVYNRTDNIKRNVVVNRTAILRNEAHVQPRIVEAHAEVRNEPARPAPIRVQNPPARVENNVYAGHDGQVYRRTDAGWEQHAATGWQKVNSSPEAQRPRNVRSSMLRRMSNRALSIRPSRREAHPQEIHNEAPAQHQPEAGSSPVGAGSHRNVRPAGGAGIRVAAQHRRAGSRSRRPRARRRARRRQFQFPHGRPQWPVTTPGTQHRVFG